MNAAETPTTQDSLAVDPNPADLKHLPRVMVINAIIIGAAIILAVLAFITSTSLADSTERAEAAHQRYEECSEATTKLLIASDYLTTQARMFVVTGDRQYMDNYLEELLVTKNRDKSVEVLNREIEDARAAAELTEALSQSNDLAMRELYAMRLTADAAGITPLPDSLKSVPLEPQDEALTPEEAQKRARTLMLDNQYRDMKSLIVAAVNDCTSALIDGIQQKESSIEKHIDRLIFWLLVIVSALVILIAFAALANYVLVMHPLRKHAHSLSVNEPLDRIGSYEMQRLVMAYNEMYENNRQTTIALKHEAETDALTELFNRGVYNKLLEQCTGNFALILIDIDKFKEINDENGHQVGDAVLKKVAAAIAFHFRETDFVCRIGGDEFAVIMMGMDPGDRSIIASKTNGIANLIAEGEEGLPEVTLSMGAAFSAEVEEDDNIYLAADKALYSAKRNGRNRCVFYSELL